MAFKSALKTRPVLGVILGLAAFALLAIRFSPNWVAFAQTARDAYAEATGPADLPAIEKAVLSGFSERGLHVVRQSRHLEATIDDSKHKIVRWRLLIPAVGYFFQLPSWMTLGLAHVGCVAWLLALVFLARAHAQSPARPPYEAACLALVAGASAPFFTSMGWLGYYDSWLVLALLAVGFVPAPWVVFIACMAGPWIDERFVIGLPLALLVRWNVGEKRDQPLWPWLKAEAAVPCVIVGCYALVRLHLGGSGSSQTVREYFHQFVIAPKVSVSDRLLGAWAGLRFGWLLIAAAVVLAGLTAATLPRLRAALLALAIVVTGLAGLYTALDLSRSMALLTPVIPLGWILASRTAAWQRFHLAPRLAVSALLLPGQHVVGVVAIAVDNAWTPSRPLLTAQNNLGMLHATGQSVPRDLVKAVAWFQRAAAAGSAEAQNNMATKYALGDGVTQNTAEALRLYRIAAAKGDLTAQYNLGVVYTEGKFVPKDGAEAARWFRQAAERGSAQAQNNLAALHVEGLGVPKDDAEAAKWYRKAAEQGFATAQVNLGALYSRGGGVPKDLVEAYAWCLIGQARGEQKAAGLIASLETRMTPPEIAAGKKRAQAMIDERKRPR
jgi:hypothetical protein